MIKETLSRYKPAESEENGFPVTEENFEEMIFDVPPVEPPAEPKKHDNEEELPFED